MKFSVFTASTPDLTPEQLVDTLKDCGYDAVEWRVAKIPEDQKDAAPTSWGNNLCTIDPDITDAELDELLKLTRQRSLEVSCLLPYLNVGDLKGTENVMRIAKKLGAKKVRLARGVYDRTVNYNVLFEEFRKYLHAVQEMAQTYGIRGLIETHHFSITPSASLAHRLVDGFNPQHIGVMYDPGNLVYEGFENFRKGLELIGPYLSHVHVKNANWLRMEQPEDGTAWAPLPGGAVDWRQVLVDLKSVGYDDYLGFEDFSQSKPTRELLKFNIDYIRSILAEI